MRRVAALTGGPGDSSSRFRIRQLMAGLEAVGIEITDFVSPQSRFPPVGNTLSRALWMATALPERANAVMESRKYDLTILQRELISTLPTFEGWTKRPRVVDIDDAIFMHRRGIAARHLAKVSDHVVCGNNYTADWFSRHGALEVSVLPTTVECDTYVPAPPPNDGIRRIGWSGSSSGYAFFPSILPALAAVLERNPDWKLRIVAGDPPPFTNIPAAQLEYIPWTAAEEVRLIQEMDIGIMPLDRTEWSKGKCSLKMIQYMSCGVPVVVTDHGMNTDVLAMGRVGYGVITPDQWIEALESLMADPAGRAAMGEDGRRVAVKHFDISVAVNHWRDLVLRLT